MKSILASVPLDETNAQYLNILSINIMGTEANYKDSEERETREQAKKRYKTTLLELAECSTSLNVDMIFLQHVDSACMLDHLDQFESIFGSKWKYVVPLSKLKVNKQVRQLIFYNQRLELSAGMKFDPLMRVLAADFKVIANDMPIHVYNVWTPSHPFPEEVEGHYISLFDRHPQELSIVLGDTGCHLDADIDIYGGFYQDVKSIIRQLSVNEVDLTKKEKIPTAEAFEDRNEKGRYPILMLDNRYSIKEVVPGKTIFAIEQELRQKFEDDEIFFRKTMHGYVFRFAGFSPTHFLDFPHKSFLDLATLFSDMIRHNITFDLTNIPDIPDDVARIESEDKVFHVLYVQPDRIKYFLDAIDAVSETKKILANWSGDLIAGREGKQRYSWLREMLRVEFLQKNAKIFSPQFSSYADEVIVLSLRDYEEFGGTKGFRSEKNVGEFISKSMLAIASFGLHSSYRRQEVKERLNTAGYKSLPSLLVIKNLLDDDGSGNDLSSFRYFLVSYLFRITAESDFEAKLLIEAAKREFKKNQYNFKFDNPRSPVARRLVLGDS